MTEPIKDFSKITIIVPTLNEEKNIGTLLQLLDEIAPHCHVIVSDDGSKDKTGEIVETFAGKLKATFLDRKDKEIHGLTISVLDAIANCTTPYFMVMDGDLQHPPEVVPEFYTMLDQSYELIAGNRIEIVGKWGIYRKMMSFIASSLGSLALFLRRRNRIKDIMTGLYGSKTEIWKSVIEQGKDKFTLEGYKVLFDFLKIYKPKLKVGHVNYKFGTRHSGESKISKKVIWLYFKSLF